MTSTTPLGREIVLAAFLEAKDRTLTNHELGALRGVQAFHQRISDNKRRGYLFTQGVRVGDGHFAYRLVGVEEGTAADVRHGLTSGPLPRFAKNDVAAAIAEGTKAVKENPPATVPAITSSSVAVEVVSAHRDRIRALERQLERVTEAMEGAEVLEEEGVAFEVAEMFRRFDDCYRDRKAAADAIADALNARDGLTGDDAIDHGMAFSFLLPRVLEALEAPKPAARARRAPSSDRVTGPQAMAEVLEAEGKPMHSRVIAERVLAAHPDLYGGKTPAATMAAQLATSNKKGDQFRKVAPGCYALASWEPAKFAQEPVR